MNGQTIVERVEGAREKKHRAQRHMFHRFIRQHTREQHHCSQAKPMRSSAMKGHRRLLIVSLNVYAIARHRATASKSRLGGGCSSSLRRYAFLFTPFLVRGLGTVRKFFWVEQDLSLHFGSASWKFPFVQGRHSLSLAM